MTNRLFIALEIPDEIKEKIISYRDEVHSGYIPGKWESIEKLHITLKFLGDTDIKKISELISELKKVTLKYTSINAEFDRFGFFLPRVLWLGFRTDQALFSMVKDLNNYLKKMNFTEEKRNFKPHITLLRIKKKLDQNFIDDFKKFNLPSLKFQMDSVLLIKSELLQSGSKYHVLEKIKLK